MAEQRVNILVYRPDGTMIAQYLLGDGEHLIGREINCPVYLDSEYISSNHAKLYLSHDGIQIEDLNSTSGTYLDGVTVRGKLRIKPGQVLQVGDLTVYLQPESEGQIGPGSRLGDGRYTLIRMLGKGGMGEVWLAKDEQLDEEVALKRLPHEVGADAMALADMRREVQKSRALSHPNIVRIHDLVQQAGEDPLISLEYVDGTDLTAIAATKTNGIFNWLDIKDWVLQLATALEYAHEEKIVHRDLKPGNIMISRKGRLKLADFGIAATVADATRRSSMEGFISGTTLYMSPQQMEGKPPKVTDDVYALGATIYELLTSRPPFYTGNVEHQVLNVTPAPPSQRLSEFGFTGEIPPYVQELVMACLAKEPEGRPQTMGAIRQWIQTEGKATGVIPKHSTKTIKQPAPVAEPAGIAEEPAPDQGKAKGALPAPVIYVVGVFFIFICFFVGKNCSSGKSDETNLDQGSNETSTEGLEVAVLPGKNKIGEKGLFLFEKNPPSSWTNNFGMQYNPESGRGLTFDIPLPKAKSPTVSIPSFSNIKSKINSYPIHDSSFTARAYWPEGENIDPTIINFDVSGSPPLTFRWGICEGNYLSDQLPFNYSLRGPNGQLIKPGANSMRGAEIISVNTEGKYTLVITHNPKNLPFDQLAFDPYSIRGQQIGKQRGTSMGFIIESNSGKKVMTLGYQVRTWKPSSETAVNSTKPGAPNSPEAAAAIEAAIRKAAGKPVGSLTKADKEKVKVLFLEDSQISDLTPFSNLYNLEELHLNQNLISDLNPIRNLENLQRLSLNNNRVLDISPIKGLTKLYAFHISNKNLTSEGNRVRDLSALKELNLLRNLGLANNHYIKDLKPLSGLVALERLNLSGNMISDIDLLKDFKNLVVLNLHNNDGINDVQVQKLKSIFPNCMITYY